MKEAEWNTERFRSASLRPKYRSASGEMEDVVSRPYPPTEDVCAEKMQYCDSSTESQRSSLPERRKRTVWKNKAKPYLAADGFS